MTLHVMCGSCSSLDHNGQPFRGSNAEAWQPLRRPCEGLLKPSRRPSQGLLQGVRRGLMPPTE